MLVFMSILELMVEEPESHFQFGNQRWSEYIDSAIKNNFFHGEGSKFCLLELCKKIKEWIIAIRLERQYKK
jgi:penicillin-binding protein 1A